MGSIIASVLAAVLPSLGTNLAAQGVEAYKAKLGSENSTEQQVATLAGREMSLQQRELELQYNLRVSQIGHWYEPEHLFCYVVVLYFAKCILWDKVLGWGTTDALGGDIATWAGLIVMGLFGKRGIENVTRIMSMRAR